MVSTGTIRAVNPVQLAHLTGIARIPRFASPIPPVVRPQLLTAQLNGFCPACANPVDHHGHSLGSMIPPDYGTLRDAGSFALFKMASSGHGLGKGAVGSNPHATYATRLYAHGLRGMGKGAVGSNPHATYATRLWAHGLRGYGLGQDTSGGEPVDPGIAPDGSTAAPSPGSVITPSIYSGAGGGAPATNTVTATPPFQVPSIGTGNASLINLVAAGMSQIPGIGAVAGPVSSFVAQAISLIGKGRREADIIVPLQNQITAQLGTITNQFRTGTNPSLGTLQQLYVQTWMLGVTFQEFVLQRAFTDRRASGQALNTLMPFIDGSSGYPVPLGAQAFPGQQGTLRWGDGTLGGPGNDGILGALSRAIAAAGGTVPPLMDLHQAANQGLPPQTASQVNAATGVASPVTSFLTTAGIPSTIGGISTTTLLMLGLGILVLSRLKFK